MKTKKRNRFLNVRVGVEFFNLLKTHPVFDSNWKAISPAFYFLQRIQTLMDMNVKHLPVSFYSVTIREIFENYTNNSYRPYLVALSDLGLLIIDDSYIESEIADNGIGSCKEYSVTPKCVELLYDSNIQYLKELQSNTQIKRRNQQSVSKRKIMKKTYGDFVKDYIHDCLTHTNYDVPTALTMISGSRWSEDAKNNVANNLISFVEKDFRELEYDKTTGRMYHEHAAMKSDFRILSTYNKMDYRAVIDIRACHPTFLSTYILSYYLHYVGGNGDIAPQVVDNQRLDTTDNSSYKKSLEEEHDKWVNLFCNNDLDPREVILNEIQSEMTIPEVKAALNESINGSKQHPEVLNWIKAKFPVMYEIWQLTDVKETGTKISSQYESTLIFREEIYKMAGEMGLKIVPEHDGYGVYALTDNNITTKLNYITKAIRNYSLNTWGVPLVMSIKVLHNKTTCVDTFLSMEGRLKDLQKEYDELAKQETRLRKRAFATRSVDDWNSYRDIQDRVRNCILRYSDVIQYWNEREYNTISP